MAPSSKQAILRIGKLTYAEEAWQDLASLGELIVFPGPAQDNDPKALFLKNLKDGLYDNVVALYRSNDSTSVGTLSNSTRIMTN